ncbi:uncharacterized protein K452DRAFT_332213 [Aplosporella prunicola CBS 121167]|uniref:non-specific serine/threonine protein kinase n=1 Tax=Aplosporella prunicola CBS 121167 TaxID=1176127 RepID=A0A6A6BEJ6_9PEZI|nr:uncharacterized protein K452DRAFT_332213 [Aplosporella prunicola CBS 121167]KAF2142486.1 hypothetical protein K452DRAFT_332213 [Aplosporella prunicola CBS 121167]
MQYGTERSGGSELDSSKITSQPVAAAAAFFGARAQIPRNMQPGSGYSARLALLKLFVDYASDCIAFALGALCVAGCGARKSRFRHRQGRSTRQRQRTNNVNDILMPSSEQDASPNATRSQPTPTGTRHQSDTMARARAHRAEPDPVHIHVDEEDDQSQHMDESRDPLEESGRTVEDSDDEEIVDEAVLDDMERFEESFKGISKKYRLINRIGEGTFSTVYKAEDLLYDQYDNSWDLDGQDHSYSWNSHRSRKRTPRYVAIKKIYVTSSPLRILNELELLHDLRDSDSVCPLITAFRHHDQVVAILPYYQHLDFREYFRDMTVSDMRLYFRSLFTALKSVHEHNILHRDIKPTNFLYAPHLARGVLVDFGLAERQGTDWHVCTCQLRPNERQHKIDHSAYASTIASNPNHVPTFPKTDTRPSRRANRAGTRGFRAPEVLLKCSAQTTSIDIWSTGVILLTLLSRRFPFFHSADDIDALLELTNIFGRARMRETALLHGQVFETNIPSYSENGHGFEKIILWCTNRSGKDEQGRRLNNLSSDEREAVEFMERCLECDPTKRITAEEALCHPFILKSEEQLYDDDDAVDMVNSP